MTGKREDISRTTHHNDQNCGKDRDGANPREPGDLLEFPDTGKEYDNDGGDESEPIGAKGMVGQGVQSSRNTDDSRASTDDISRDEQKAHYLLDDDTAHKFRHVGNTVAARVRVTEVALDDGAVGVEECPSDDVDGTGKGSQRVHGCWD